LEVAGLWYHSLGSILHTLVASLTVKAAKTKIRFLRVLRSTAGIPLPDNCNLCFGCSLSNWDSSWHLDESFTSKMGWAKRIRRDRHLSQEGTLQYYETPRCFQFDDRGCFPAYFPESARSLYASFSCCHHHMGCFPLLCNPCGGEDQYREVG